MERTKRLVALGGLATLLSQIFHCFYIWLPRTYDARTPSQSLKFCTIFGTIMMLTGFVVVGSLTYALRTKLTGFVLLTIGAAFLAPTYLIVAALAGLYSQTVVGVIPLTLPGIAALGTFLLALYYKSEYENSVSANVRIR